MPASDAHIEDHQLHEIDAPTSIRWTIEGKSPRHRYCHIIITPATVTQRYRLSTHQAARRQRRRGRTKIADRSAAPTRASTEIGDLGSASARGGEPIEHPRRHRQGGGPWLPKSPFCTINDRAGTSNHIHDVCSVNWIYSKRTDIIPRGWIDVCFIEDACGEPRLRTPAASHVRLHAFAITFHAGVAVRICDAGHSTCVMLIACMLLVPIAFF